MEWNDLLTTRRFGKDVVLPYDESTYRISEFEKDYNKIISSAPFRRLQDKTQVFPLDKSDFVRTRLTHSIETSAIAKRLATMIAVNISKYKATSLHKIEEFQISEICNLLLCAGLLHDLGNPPFGHFGEAVISNWFKIHLNSNDFTYKGETIGKLLTEHMKNDLQNFDGNVQNLRILTKLNYIEDGYGLNLTKSVLNTLIKYPNDSLASKGKGKFGYYLAEKEEFEKILEDTKVYDNCRHPLTYILEAADDIAYTIADLEDAVKKKVLNTNDFIDFFYNELKNTDEYTDKKKRDKSKILIDELLKIKQGYNDDCDSFSYWCKFVQDWLLYACAFSFTNNYNLIMEGKYQNDLFYNTYHEYSVKIIKKASVKFIFPNDDIVRLELAAETILNSLLDKFVPAILYFDVTDEHYKQSVSDKRLTILISKNYKECYEMHKTDNEVYNLYLRFLLVIDFISGMTDTYAKDIYQLLNGIY